MCGIRHLVSHVCSNIALVSKYKWPTVARAWWASLAPLMQHGDVSGYRARPSHEERGRVYVSACPVAFGPVGWAKDTPVDLATTTILRTGRPLTPR